MALLFHGITVCETTGDLLIVTTLAEDGNLGHRIEKPIDCGLDMAGVAHIVTRLAYNLASLHDEIRMCHRNIHPGNILCADDDDFLIDFRSSTASEQATEVTQSFEAHYGKHQAKKANRDQLDTEWIYRPYTLHSTRSETREIHQEIRCLRAR